MERHLELGGERCVWASRASGNANRRREQIRLTLSSLRTSFSTPCRYESSRRLRRVITKSWYRLILRKRTEGQLSSGSRWRPRTDDGISLKSNIRGTITPKVPIRPFHGAHAFRGHGDNLLASVPDSAGRVSDRGLPCIMVDCSRDSESTRWTNVQWRCGFDRRLWG